MSLLDFVAEIAYTHYGLQGISSIRVLPGRRHSFLISILDTRYVLKCVAVSELPATGLDAIHLLVDFLVRAGFDTYSVVESNCGSSWVIDGDMVWEMHTYLPGCELESLAVDPSGVGELLGRYHRTVDHYVRCFIKPPHGAVLNCQKSIDPRLTLKGLSLRTRAASQLADIDTLARMSRSWVEAVLPHGQAILLHGDISASNIIVSSARKCLIDFEDVTWGYPYWDVAQAVARMIAPLTGDVSLCRTAVDYLLSAYWRSYGVCLPDRRQLRAAVGLHLISDWASALVSAHRPDQSVAKTLPLLRRGLDLLEDLLV